MSSATTVKAAPMISAQGTQLAVSADGKTLATTDGHAVFLYDAQSGKKLAEVKSGVGAKPGPVIAAGNLGFVVQAMGEKKRRFSLIAGGKAEPVPFRLPKDTDVPALPVAYASEAKTMIGLLAPTAALTDVLAWDFTSRPPVESPRTGLATYCWRPWINHTRAYALCEDGLHAFDLVPPGNNNQVGAVDETIVAPRGAMAAGDGLRVVWVANGELMLDDFTNDKAHMRKSAKLPTGAAVAGLVLVPDMAVVAASMTGDNVVYLWSYLAEAGPLTKVKVSSPTYLAVSEQPGRLWVRTGAGVLRVDVATVEPASLP